MTAPLNSIDEGATFGSRLRAAMDEYGPVCVGIDPHEGLLEAWDLPVSAEGAREFGLRVVEALGGRVAAMKPQSAFFECFGSAGVAALEEVLAAGRSAGTAMILDVKRGDIGSTMAGYARAHLMPGAPGEADAITLSPYLGAGALAPALDMAAEHGKGAFLLALTSNPEGALLQHATTADGRSVAGVVIDEVASRNAGAAPMGSFGVVIGATIGSAVRDLGLDLAAMNGPFLAPGIGAQGAGPDEVRDVFGEARSNVLASASRSVLSGGPSVDGLRAAAAQAVEDLGA